MMETTEISNHINELCEILWGFISHLDRVRHTKKPAAVDKVLRVSHAIAQLSGAYLKAVEAQALYQEVPELRERLATLQAHQRNGHGTLTDRAEAD
jgi:hypothetical protein